ncbi:MAG TPA: FAD-dependent oxidoreductase [Steroidobacteraceae bacterium]|nr:FAD-dependent oxidoreductase [Steroidobacteraceae bacterium]
MSVCFDLVVIGAGIHGTGIAQAGAAAGHSVLLLEQTAVAAGSSSRSSKLIHGGLRYLETGQFALVRESLRERALMLRLAPALVHLQRFYIPVYAHTRRRPWQLRLGLTLYALLGSLRAESRFGTVPRDQWHRLDGLDTTDLEAVFYYHDGQTDDRLLTRAVLRSAEALGAQLRCPAQFQGARLEADGVTLSYAQDGQIIESQARVLVNAAGPWAEPVAHRIAPAIRVPPLECVQGAHIVLRGQPERGIYYLESPRDGRAVFVMPWQGQMLVGTTESRFHGDPSAVAAHPAEIHYLLGVLKHYFPHTRALGEQDLIASFAGVRVLPGGSGHAFHRSRETQLILDREVRPRVLSIYGGKLTTWRAVCARALARIAASLPPRRALARTDALPLSPE